jgi:hypothetical protein
MWVCPRREAAAAGDPLRGESKAALLWYKKPHAGPHAYHRNLNLDFDAAWIRYTSEVPWELFRDRNPCLTDPCGIALGTFKMVLLICQIFSARAARGKNKNSTMIRPLARIPLGLLVPSDSWVTFFLQGRVVTCGRPVGVGR